MSNNENIKGLNLNEKPKQIDKLDKLESNNLNEKPVIIDNTPEIKKPINDLIKDTTKPILSDIDIEKSINNPIILGNVNS
jgi:hypothetical protein